MSDSPDTEFDYQRVEKALRYVAANYQNQPDLADIASSVHLSEAHFQRLFKRWAGVSPKQFLQYLTLDHARQCLSQDMTVMHSAFDSGLAAPARLNELFIRLESITPAEFKRKGDGITIEYGFQQTPFGHCVMGVTGRGISGLEFYSEADGKAGRKKALASMMDRLPAATYQCNQECCAHYCDLVFGTGNSADLNPTLSLLVRGTAFQIKVWEALLRIPSGGRVSYKQLAKAAGFDGAHRAVGTAVGKNPVAVLIPCHRVIREDGMLGGYHWGLERKLALLGAESVSSRGVMQPRGAQSHEERVVL